MSLDSGTKLGRYEIRSLIGAGGMGEVYLARDPKIGRDVAIKVLPATFLGDKERLARFEQEAQAAGALNHPNILAIFDVDANDEAAYVVSELLEGATLRDVMGSTPMAVRKAIDYALQAAHGLAAAHEKGIIHRDLKPENLFVTSDGRVKILDFGLAKLIENGDGLGTDLPTRKVNTSAGAVMGTAGYMSPEQLRGKPVDPRTDIFSFGAVLYEMLTGRRAFQKDSTADTISAILREDPPEISSTNSSVNPGLEKVVHRCLEKNREQRFHSASDLAFALESLTTDQTSNAETSVMNRQVSVLSKTTNRHNWLAWIIAAVLFAALVGVSVLYLRRGTTSPDVIRFAIAAPQKTIYGESLAISPDGRRIAFVAIGPEGVPSLWVRSIDSLESRQLAGTDGAANPFWSPDSRFIGFFADTKLKKTDAGGGPPQTLAEASVDSRGGSWNSDGTIIFSPTVFSPILKVPANGGPTAEVTSLNAELGQISHRWPQFLPDGRHFLYYGRGGREENQGIYVGSLDSQESKFLMSSRVRGVFARGEGPGSSGYLLFMRDLTLFAQPVDTGKWELSGEPVAVADNVLNFPSEMGPTASSTVSVSDNGRMLYLVGGKQMTEFSWFDHNGKLLETINQPGKYHEPAESPDGKRLVYSLGGDLAMFELGRGASTRFTFDPAEDVAAIWTTDGSRVLFASNRGGNFKIYQKLASGATAEELLVDTPQNAFPDAVSPDGKYLIYELDGGPETKFDLWSAPLSGDGKPQPYLNSPFVESHAAFSPDGRWVAYTSDESGRTEVFVQSFPASGGKWQVSIAGGDQPMWSRNGRELYYIAPDRNLMSVPINPGTTFDAGKPAVLFQTHVPVTGLTDDRNNYLPSADGQRFLVNHLVDEGNTQPIVVVLNWSADIKK